MSWTRRIRPFLPQGICGPMAVLYEKLAAPGLAGFHRQVASEVASSLTRGRVLDVGTGPGHLLVEIARRNPALELVGLDLSRKMLGIARTVTRRTPVDAAARVEPIRLVQGDVRELPFCDGTFDMVVSTLSLHHWHEPARGIRECLRVTAPGGRCRIYDLRSDVPARAHAAMVTGGPLRRLVLGHVFRFHGVHPDEYGAQAAIARRLGRGAQMGLDLNAAYLRLELWKPASGGDDGTSQSGGCRAPGRDSSSSACKPCAGASPKGEQLRTHHAGA